MVVVQASKLTIPNLSLSPSPAIASILYDPHSLSLALMHSDSSFSLYPRLSPLSLPSSSSLPPPQTLVPPPSSSSAFLLLRRDADDSSSRVVFLVSGPHRGGSQILLRFFVLQSSGNKFARARVVCKQKGLSFDPSSGVVFDNRHGVSIKISGSTNFFAMYSISSGKIWVFAVKALRDGVTGGGGHDGGALELMRCAVIECCKPVWSISFSFGLIVLGEENGVRVFNLMAIVKGGSKRVRNLNPNGKLGNRQLPNGVTGSGIAGNFENARNVSFEGKNDKHPASVKQSTVKLKQEASNGSSCFVTLKSDDDVASTSISTAVMSLKALYIQPLSPRSFIVLDSVGDLHLVCLPKSKTPTASDVNFHLKHMPHVMKVQHLTAFPDITMSKVQELFG
ncbi:uncharacterized protein LOC115745344 isoform X2 [Rhodamnia argentea]|uniref:Uncharacterized protein LOC115745344 isoform X2 n=1 Tax=Rhodamnia argentea TaxID=178133 RepID=A0A8B8PQW5_9MYRT|nr:uncharacterized protein LOC115745344 isoform X2 [Rhodamnia argentea]